MEALGFIDLFSGCGGLTRGLEDTGLRCLAAYDSDPFAVKVHNLNFPNGKAQVVDVTALSLPQGAAPIIVAGLPCQSFSTLGKMRADDPLNELWRPFVRIVAEVMPTAWAIEINMGIPV